MNDETDEITFAELDRLCDLDPLDLTKQNLDKLIRGMRLYRANALGKGKATKFSDASGVKLDTKAMLASLGVEKAKPLVRRPK